MEVADLKQTACTLFHLQRWVFFFVFFLFFFQNHQGIAIGVCNQGELRLLYRLKKEVTRAIVTKESMAFHWPSPFQERRESFFFLLDTVIVSGQ